MSDHDGILTDILLAKELLANNSVTQLIKHMVVNNCLCKSNHLRFFFLINEAPSEKIMSLFYQTSILKRKLYNILFPISYKMSCLA